MKKAFYALAFLVASSAASAVTVTVDFEALPLATDSVNAFNYIDAASGLRFSPSYHFDTGQPEAGSDDPAAPDYHPLRPRSRWIGFDGAGEENRNPNFLGASFTDDPDAALLFVDLSGRRFSLVALDPIHADWTITSSAGGFEEISGFNPEDPQRTLTFGGSAWSNVEWLMFQCFCGAPVGFDNMVVSVPASAEGTVPVPATAALFGLGALGALRRRR